MAQYKVNVKWVKQLFKDVELDTSEPVTVFKAQLFALTGVPVERMKVLVPKGGQLKDSSPWTRFPLKDGLTLTLIGSASSKIKPPSESVTFVEDVPQAERRETAHSAGLVNLGNTCYFNASLQALAALPELRQAVDASSPSLASIGGQVKSVVHSMHQQSMPVTPMGLLLEFRARFPQFAEQERGHFAQQDADECLKQLITALGDQQSAPAVTDLFKGEMTVTSVCAEAQDETSVAMERFTSLQCNIDRETAFLQQALKDSMKQQVEKQSQSLGRNAVFEKTSAISELPFCLPVQFVRFYYNQKKKLNAKITRPVAFPFRLDAHSLCTTQLQEQLEGPRDAMEKADLAKAHGEMKEKEEKEEKEEKDVEMAEPVEKLRNNTGYYDLVALITHQGRAVDSGHYVAWVRADMEDDDKWLKFDDDKVSACKKEDVRKLSGDGGADWHMAYICVYRSVVWTGE